MVLMERDRENRRMGRYDQTVAAVRRGRNKYPPEVIEDFMGIDLETIESIFSAIDAHPDWDDEEIAEYLDFD